MKIVIIGSGRIVSSIHLPLLSCIDNVKIEFIEEFDFNIIPGPFLNNLANTRTLLKNIHLDVF
tara:strand:- start:338 stop:526 length:189 start_codon:yes stop_codon:yes gene_type:complete